MFIILTGSCTSVAAAKDDGTNTLSVYIRQETKRSSGSQYEFTTAAPSRVVFVVKNNSNDFIIIRAFSTADGLPDLTRWYGSFYGSVNYKPLEDIWVYNQMSQMLCKPVFAAGLIRPEQEYEIISWVIPKKDTIDIDISYQRLTKTDALNKIYFNTPETGGNPLQKTFKHITDIDTLSDKAANVDWSLVIMPRADEEPVKKQHINCRATLHEPAFTLSQAESRIDANIVDYVFWASQDCWAIKTDKGTYLVGKDKVIKLPETDLLSFALIESQSGKVSCILPLSRYEQFDAQKPHIEGPGYFNPGVTEMLKEKLVSLFEYAGKRGDRISVLVYGPTGLGMRLYLLIGQFDEEIRRKSVQ